MWRDTSRIDSHRQSDRDIEIMTVQTVGIEGNPANDGSYHTWGIVKVETDGDHYGIGETYRGREPLCVVEQMADLVQGENPLDVDRLNETLNRHYTASGGIGQAAISAIDMALWDLKGKLLDVPVYELLGGAYRDTIPVYADSQAAASQGAGIGSGKAFTPDSYARAARDVVDQGFEALKFDLDVPTPGTETDTASRRLTNEAIDHKVSLVRAVREAVGYGVDIGMDLHWMFTTETAVKLGQRLEEFDLDFLEDPVHPYKLDAQRRVREKVNIPILTGENVSTPENFYNLLENDVLDIAAPDVSRFGGLGELWKTAALCDIHSIPMAPHNLASPVGTVAGVHLGAAIPNFYSLEYRGGDCPWWNDLVVRTDSDRPILERGRIAVPEGPGLGVEIDPSVAEKHLTAGSKSIF